MARVPSSSSSSPARLLFPLLLLLLQLLAADAARLPLSLTPSDATAAANALLKLKSGIKDPTNALSSWSADTSPCGDSINDAGTGTGPTTTTTWKGVMCSKDGEVHGLQLEGLGLSGGDLDLRALAAGLPGPGLRTLSFMDNEFSGPLPDVKALSGLRAVFLSGNRFSGAIPGDAFAGMGSLKKVVLSKNGFTGPIPKSLADAPRLIALQVNDNMFQGRIPEMKQEELRDVNLANNQLEGPIPSSLKSLPPDMFAGNKKLCGPPLGAKCDAEAPPSPSPSPSAETPPPAASAKQVATQPTPAADTMASTGASSSDDAKQDEAGQTTKGTTSTMSMGILAAVLCTLAIAGVALVALRRRRDYKSKNFGPAASRPPSSSGTPPPPQQHPPAAGEEKAEAEGSSTAAAAAAASTGGGSVSSARGGGSVAGGRNRAEQGRLTFVREEDERGRFFELQDLLKATAEVLGTANLGVCYSATLTSGHAVVVKRFKEMNRVGREDFEEHMRRLGRLSHPNLLSLVAYYYRKEEKLLIHDYVPNRSLANLLHGGGNGAGKPPAKWAARLRIVKGVARALGYLYDELCMLTVPHGHLKSSNILLDGRYEPLLTDYALVPVMNQSHAAQLMVAFKSPERKQFGKSSKKSDVWCLGLLILEMLTGKPPSYETPKPGASAASAAGESSASSTNDLVTVVGSTPESEWMETVVDPELRGEEEEDREEMVKLMKVGMACCETNVDTRWELRTAVDRIEELKAKDRPADQEQAFYSTVNGGEDV